MSTTAAILTNTWIVRVLIAWSTMFVSGSIIAIAMGPWIAPTFGEMIRNPESDGLHWPSLLGGYLVISIVLVWLMQSINSQSPWQAILLGLNLGLAVFLGDHLVTAGWSKLPALSMLISGILDSLAVIVSSIILYLLTHNTAETG